ncbi:phospholipase C, phosphocholine-specific [Pseudonocardiaceae bacterium YIM PH 21723]|nr:phospholipase C, phosphocholine-specific [Pseudonocardiaceae bacterium YIM PH 21723]
MSVSRRTFFGAAAAASTLSALGPNAAQALSVPGGKGGLDEVEHVVILMQENRSFDHFYGTMRGVRGFADRTAVRNVYRQPAKRGDGYLLPFHVDTRKVDGQDLGDLAHGWTDQHNAQANGLNNGWVAAKSEMTMGYFTETDVPFHRALADAFTIGDHYYCSIAGPTTPNRLYMWTGTIDPAGKQGGAAIGNPADYKPVYRWTTYPERLQAAGISWRVFANDEVGDDPGGHPFVGDYGDNPLWLFDQYHNAANKELAERARVGRPWLPDSGKGKDTSHVLADFIQACQTGTLPAVSWVVAPYGYTEHPEARPVDGAAYVQGMLNALWSNPELWAKTVVLINYDENDGFYDHLCGPQAPAGTPDEFVNGKPIGLGPRVPLTVISPWSRGGWNYSQVSDHTSVLRFLEAWTGVREPNISAWRRSICGDLTAAFDFGTANTTIPLLPDTAKLRAEADATQTKLPKPAPPKNGRQLEPVVETGTRPARALPYQPSAAGVINGKNLELTLGNTGAAGLQLVVHRYDGTTGGPWPFDLVSAQAKPKLAVSGKYDMDVHGPNGFLRTFTGDAAKSGFEANASLTDELKLRLTLVNRTSREVTVTIKPNAYRGDGPWSYTLAAGETKTDDWNPVVYGHGWYDMTATITGDPSWSRRFAGHVETGEHTVTG